MTVRDGVEIDTSNLHPGVIFVQDPRTRYTVAIEAATGEPIGLCQNGAELPTSHALWRIVNAASDEREPRRDD